MLSEFDWLFTLVLPERGYTTAGHVKHTAASIRRNEAALEDRREDRTFKIKASTTGEYDKICLEHFRKAVSTR